MTKGAKKKFIDRKNAVTFRLVHRSQHDPLVADESAPQHVLIPLEQQIKRIEKSKSKAKTDPENTKESKKVVFKISHDEEYKYLEQLTDVNKLKTTTKIDDEEKGEVESKKINLPSSVFESNVEEKVGLLNRDAPQGLRLDLDPDVVAGMDDDFDFDDPNNFLEENFVELANASGSEADNEEMDTEEFKKFIEEFEASSAEENDSDEDSEAHESDEISSLPSLDKEKFKPYFNKSDSKSQCDSSFSISSSVIRRNERLQLLDYKHEQIMSQFDDTEIGALDCDEIEGEIDLGSNLLLQCAKEFEKERKENNCSIADLMKDRLKITGYNYQEEMEDNDLIAMTVDAREKDKWDCESILSLNSNTKNHPGIISEKKKSIDKIVIDPRTGIPKNVLGNTGTKLTAKNLKQFNIDNLEVGEQNESMSVATSRKDQLMKLSCRPTDETLEEKRERKKNLKEFRRNNRAENKANALAFKEERKRQEKIAMNKRANIQGNKIA